MASFGTISSLFFVLIDFGTYIVGVKMALKP